MIDLDSGSSPTGRTGAAAASDRGSPETIYLFGGATSTSIIVVTNFDADLWAFDVKSGIWRQLSAGNGPSARAWGALTWDEGQHRLILFGGAESLSGPVRNDVWAFDPKTTSWTQLTVKGGLSPAPCFMEQMVYLPDQGKHLVFGGGTGIHLASTQGVDNELWLLTVDAQANTASWERVQPQTSVAPRGASCLGLDRARQRLVVYGGEDTSQALDDGMEFDVVDRQWTAFSSASGAPGRRGSANCTFDERSGKLILQGGEASPNGSPMNDLYTYEPKSQRWTQLPGTFSAGQLSYGAATYSPALGGMFVFGGRSTGYQTTQGTWALDVNAPPTVQASSVSAATSGETVFLNATASDPDGDALTYRWAQTSGPPVVLQDSDTAQSQFVVPRLASDSAATFTVTADDGTDPETAVVTLQLLGDASGVESLPDGGRRLPLGPAALRLASDCSSASGVLSWSGLLFLAGSLLLRRRAAHLRGRS